MKALSVLPILSTIKLYITCHPFIGKFPYFQVINFVSEHMMSVKNYDYLYISFILIVRLRKVQLN